MSCAGVILATVCSLTAPDKVAHYAVGATIAATSAVVLPGPHAAEWGLALTAAAAVGKELNDRRHPETHRAEAKDAVATLLGGGLVYAALRSERLRVSTTPAGGPQLQYRAEF